MILGATTFHLIGVQSLVPFHHISCKWSSLRRGYEWECFQEERVLSTHHSNVPSGTKTCQGTWDWWLGKRVSWRVYGHRSWREGMGCHVTDLSGHRAHKRWWPQSENTIPTKLQQTEEGPSRETETGGIRCSSEVTRAKDSEMSSGSGDWTAWQPSRKQIGGTWTRTAESRSELSGRWGGRGRDCTYVSRSTQKEQRATDRVAGKGNGCREKAITFLVLKVEKKESGEKHSGTRERFVEETFPGWRAMGLILAPERATSFFNYLTFHEMHWWSSGEAVLEESQILWLYLFLNFMLNRYNMCMELEKKIHG